VTGGGCSCGCLGGRRKERKEEKEDEAAIAVG